MAIKEKSSASDGFQSGVEVRERNAHTLTRVFQSDDYLNALDEAPQIGDPYPSRPEFRVVRVEKQGSGAEIWEPEQEGPDYTHAIVTVDYANTMLELDGTPVASIDSQPDVIIVPNVVWVDDDTPIEDGLVQIILSKEVIRVVKRASYRPSGGILACIGKINSSTYTPPGVEHTYQAGQLRFDGCPSDREWATVNGILVRIWKMTYQFTSCNEGWNNRLRGDTGEWKQISQGYEYADFANLGL